MSISQRTKKNIAKIPTRSLQKQDFSARRDLLIPACILFTAIIFLFFAIAYFADTPVTDAKWEFYSIYHGDKPGNPTTQVVNAQQNHALSLQMMTGFLLFSVAFVLLRQIKRLDLGRALNLLLHFSLSAVAFFIFVILFGGYFSDTGIGPSMAMIAMYAVIYWFAYGIGQAAVHLPDGVKSSKVIKFIRKHIPTAFVIFTAALFITTVYAIIGGELFEVKVTTRIEEEQWWPELRVENMEYATIINPLTPTINNYMRYLCSGLVIALGIALLYTKLNAIVKVILNFAVIFSGLAFIWLAQLDYFKLPYLSANMITAIVVFLSLYVAILLAASITLFVRKRRSEETDKYESQFSVAKKSNTVKDD